MYSLTLNNGITIPQLGLGVLQTPDTGLLKVLNRHGSK